MIAPKQGAIFVGIYYIIYYISLEYTTYKKNHSCIETIYFRLSFAPNLVNKSIIC